MDFLVPIYVGALVTFTACVNAAWTSSMEIGVRVEAENVLAGTIEHTNTAYLTFVALGADGRPTAVPPAQSSFHELADARGAIAADQPPARATGDARG